MSGDSDALWAYRVGRWEPHPVVSMDRVACVGCGRTVYVVPFPQAPPAVCPTCGAERVEAHT